MSHPLSDAHRHTLDHLRTHLGEGPLSTRYPLLPASRAEWTSAITTLGIDVGWVVRASLALVDLYVIDSQIIAAEARDLAHTDLLADIKRLNTKIVFPDPYPYPVPETYRITIALLSDYSEDLGISTLAYDGWSAAFTNYIANTIYTQPLPQLTMNVVDLSTGWAPGIRLEGTVSTSEDVVWAWHTGPKATKLYVSTRGLRELLSPAESDFGVGDVAYIHTSLGKTVIALSDEVSDHKHIDAIDYVYSPYGHVKVLARLKPDATYNIDVFPYITQIVGPVTRLDADSVGQVVCVDPEGGWVFEEEVSVSRISHCPACRTKLIQTSQDLFCLNPRCPGVVASRIQCLAETLTKDGMSMLYPLNNANRCWEFITRINLAVTGSTTQPSFEKHHIIGPVTFAEAILALFFVEDQDALLGDEQSKTCDDVGLGEMADYIRDLLATYDDPTSWVIARGLLTSLGLLSLTNRMLTALIQAAQARLEPPFPFLTEALCSPSILYRIGIPTDLIPTLAAEANQRRDELETLNRIFGV